MKEKKLTPQEQIFVQQIVKHGDRLKAYKHAHPDVTHGSARTLACRLMKKVYILDAIEAEMKKVLAKTAHYHVDVLKEKLETLAGMRDILTAVLNGDIKTEKAYKVNDDVKTIELKASVKEVLQTVNTNLKLFKNLDGSAAPIRYEVFIDGEPAT